MNIEIQWLPLTSLRDYGPIVRLSSGLVLILQADSFTSCVYFQRKTGNIFSPRVTNTVLGYIHKLG